MATSNSLETFRIGYLNKVELGPWFKKSLDLPDPLVGYFKINAFLVYVVCFHKTVHGECFLDKSVEQF